jgi:hypothetical protein
VERRTYLGLLGGTVATLGGCQLPDRDRRGTPVVPDAADPADPGTGTPSTETEPAEQRTPEERTRIRFDETVNVVEEYDCDPSGESACDEQLREAAADDRLLVFPEGSYQLENRLTLEGLGSVGLEGTGDARLVAPATYNDILLDVDVGEFLLRNINVDIRGNNTTAGIRALTDETLHVEDVEYLGRGVHSDRNVVHGLLPVVRNPGGGGTIRNYVATQGSAWGHYGAGNGRAGIYIGQMNRGTITIVDAHLEEFGDSGIYATGTPGDVRVHGGEFRNNNVAAIRIGGAGSLVTDATIEASLSIYGGPRSNENEAFRLRGIMLNQKSAYIDKPPGVRVEDCDIHIESDLPNPGAGIAIQGPAKTATIRRTSIRIDADGTPAVYRAPKVPYGSHQPSDEPRWVELDGVEVTGRGARDAGVKVEEASYSTLRDVTVDLHGGGRDGVRLVQSHGCIVDGGSVRSRGYPLVVDVTDPGLLEGELVTFGEPPRLQRLPEWRNLDGGYREARTPVDGDEDTPDPDLRTLESAAGPDAITLPRSNGSGFRILVTNVADDQVSGYVGNLHETP